MPPAEEHTGFSASEFPESRQDSEVDESNLPSLPRSRIRGFDNDPFFSKQEIPALPSEPSDEAIAPKKEKKDKEIFIRIDNFKQIVEAIENMDKKITEAEELIEKLQKINNEENSDIENWKSNLGMIREEIKTIGENLSEG